MPILVKDAIQHLNKGAAPWKAHLESLTHEDDDEHNFLVEAASFEGLEVENYDFTGVTFSNCTFKENVFTSCEWNASTFQNCKLSSVEFNEGGGELFELKSCELNACNFYAVWFSSLEI